MPILALRRPGTFFLGTKTTLNFTNGASQRIVMNEFFSCPAANIRYSGNSQFVELSNLFERVIRQFMADQYREISSEPVF
jgi:hypothetical protein